MAEQQFVELCGDGKLDEAKQWLETNPTINISAKNEQAFRDTCENRHLEVAQWLLQVCPTINISAFNDWAFRYAFVNGHLKVAQWLQSLKPYLYVIYYNEDGSYKGYYIRNKEEERWEKRKLLVWLASDQSPNKECLFYILPQDVSRYIISKYL